MASPIIADMNGDGRNDVGVGNDWGYFVVDGPTGNEMYSVNEFYSLEAAAAVGDFGNLGWRLIVSAFDTPNNNTRIQAYQIPGPGRLPAVAHVPPHGIARRRASVGRQSHRTRSVSPVLESPERAVRERGAARVLGARLRRRALRVRRRAVLRQRRRSAQRRERGGHADVAEWQRLLHPHEPR